MEIVWGVVSVVVSVLVGAGFSVMGLSPPEFKLAKLFFGLSAFSLGVTDLIWHVETTRPVWWQVTVGGMVWSAVLVGFPLTWSWINKRQVALLLQPSPLVRSTNYSSEWRELGR